MAPRDFAKQLGLPLKEFFQLANYTKRVDAEAVMIWDAAYKSVNARMGELMRLRILLERRELRARKAKVGAKLVGRAKQ